MSTVVLASPIAHTRQRGENLRVDALASAAREAEDPACPSRAIPVTRHLLAATQANNLSPRSLEVFRAQLQKATSPAVAPVFERVLRFANEVFERRDAGINKEKAHTVLHTLDKIMTQQCRDFRDGTTPPGLMLPNAGTANYLLSCMEGRWRTTGLLRQP